MKRAMSLLLMICASQANSADIVLTNGQILQVDPAFNTVSAIAIENGEIIATGTDQDISKHINSDTHLVDLKGKTIIPGLIDNHMHLIRAAQNWQQQIRLEGVLDYQAALDKIAAAAARAKPGEWLIASGGFVERQFANRPSAGFLRTDLDRAAPDNPVYLQHLFDWGYANSAAMKAVSINPEKPVSIPGLLLDSNGLPEGPVTKRAQWLIEQKIAEQTNEKRLAHSKKALQDLTRAGLTTVVDAGGFDTTDALYAPFIELDKQNQMPMRLFYMKQVIPWGSGTVIPDLSRLNGVQFRQGSEFFRPIGVGEQLMLPVQDTAGRPAKSSPEVKQAFLDNATELAKQGIQLHLHAVNDQSINQHLDAFEQINQTTPLAPLRWTLAHVDGIIPDTIDRANKLGIHFAIHSRPVLIGYRFQNTFGTIAREMTPMRTLTEKGALWGLGSDSPVVSIYNPFRTLWWAVNGTMVDGTRVSDQNIDRKQALIAHTINNARLAFMEDKLGSLEVGKQADLVILNKDYMSIDAARIATIKPLATMVNGRWVYRSSQIDL